jgi:hypothetical protein
MKRLIYLATVSMLALLILAPTAMADNHGAEGTVMMEETVVMGETTVVEQTVAAPGAEGDLPESGGPGILLPAAALLLGAGILTFAVVRRRA